jgi:hypothetical protein
VLQETSTNGCSELAALAEKFGTRIVGSTLVDGLIR